MCRDRRRLEKRRQCCHRVERFYGRCNDVGPSPRKRNGSCVADYDGYYCHEAHRIHGETGRDRANAPTEGARRFGACLTFRWGRADNLRLAQVGQRHNQSPVVRDPPWKFPATTSNRAVRTKADLIAALVQESIQNSGLDMEAGDGATRGGCGEIHGTWRRAKCRSPTLPGMEIQRLDEPGLFRLLMEA